MSKYIAVLAGWLVAIGTMGQAVKSWNEIESPAFIFGAVMALGVSLGALHLDAPTRATGTTTLALTNDPPKEP